MARDDDRSVLVDIGGGLTLPPCYACHPEMAAQTPNLQSAQGKTL